MGAKNRTLETDKLNNVDVSIQRQGNGSNASKPVEAKVEADTRIPQVQSTPLLSDKGAEGTRENNNHGNQGGSWWPLIFGVGTIFGLYAVYNSFAEKKKRATAASEAAVKDAAIVPLSPTTPVPNLRPAVSLSLDPSAIAPSGPESGINQAKPVVIVPQAKPVATVVATPAVVRAQPVAYNHQRSQAPRVVSPDSQPSNTGRNVMLGMEFVAGVVSAALIGAAFGATAGIVVLGVAAALMMLTFGVHKSFREELGAANTGQAALTSV